MNSYASKVPKGIPLLKCFVLIYPRKAYIIVILITDSFKVSQEAIMEILRVMASARKSEIDGVMIKLCFKIHSCLGSVPALIR